MAILSVVIAATLTQPPRKFIQWKKRIKRDAGRPGETAHPPIYITLRT